MNHTVHTYRALGLGDVGLPEHVLVEAFLGELGLLRPGTVVLNLADSETEATAVVRAQEDVDLGDATARVRHARRAVAIVLAALLVLPRAVERAPADATHSLWPTELAVIRHLLHLANADVGRASETDKTEATTTGPATYGSHVEAVRAVIAVGDYVPPGRIVQEAVGAWRGE